MFKKIWKQSDQQLVQLCLKGDPAAWESLVSRYQRLVYHFPTDAKLSHQDCDDVFQETFLATYKSLEKLLAIQALDHWIATVAKRATWRMVQRNRRDPTEVLVEEFDLEDPDLIPDEHLETRLQQASIRRGVGMLNGRCRTLLHLLFYKYESTEYDKVAKEAGIARGSIGPIRHRCLVKLKNVLEEMGINQKSVSKRDS